MEKAFSTFLKLILIVVLAEIFLTLTLGNVLTNKDEKYVFSGVVKEAIWFSGRSSKGGIFFDGVENEETQLITYNPNLIKYLNTQQGREYQFEYYKDYTFSILSPQMIILNYKSMEGK